MSVTPMPDRQPASADDRLILSRSTPLDSARRFVADRYTFRGSRTLHHHSGMFFVWDGSAFDPADEAAVRAEVYAFLEDAFCRRQDPKTGEWVEEPFRPTRSRVNDVLDAVRAATNLPASIEPPAWLAGAPKSVPPPREILACRNGLLHLPRGKLLDRTPLFWTHTGLPFDFDPLADEPEEWHRFLASIWPDDQQAIDTLQELFGYLLTADTSQQKLFLLVGPKRSGKGTIARVLQALLGRNNVVSPTLGGLSENFGLAPLIGKTAAIISDARLSARADQATIAERLLSISGEDAVTVDRKFLPAWTGQLSTRFVLLTNELPRLSDASGALASRFVVLTMQNSFYGREDPGLTSRLLEDLPGILNWAIDGWKRLQDRGHFVQPASSQEAIEELEDLGSPISAFVKDRCTVAPGEETLVSELFTAWRAWCEEHGRDRPGTQQSFGRDLKAAVPGIVAKQARDINGNRVRVYRGIRLT